nr:n-alpha-acetyltransferase 35, natc auxiliary subunit [Quercus suber]
MADDAAAEVSVPERTSIPSGDDSVWADVSPLLESACKDLRDGELIHGDNFNLFAAMSALEIMDPKMDSGIVCKYYSIDEAIENGAAPVPISINKTVDVQCTIDIMDHLLACEATWHKGHSLAQTVFSCIYLLRPDRTSSHALLHSYCRVIRATCKAVISVVSDARTHEEDDLFTMAYGLPLDGDGDEKCLSLLNAVEETISRQLRACKAPSSRRRVLEDMEPLQTNLDLEEGYCKALLCRLRFPFLPCSYIYEAASRERSSASGTSEDGIEDRTTASGCQPIGFDASLNCRLSAPTPPRAIKILSWKKAIEYFVKLLHDLDIICSYSLDPSLEGVLQFVVQFQKSQPDLVARAHLQLLLVQDGKLYGRDSMFAVITRAAVLPEVAKNHDVQKNEYFVQLGQLVINMLKILCTNAAWQRLSLWLLCSYKIVLLVQDGKLYGRDSMFAVITRAAVLPEVAKNHDVQKNEYFVQLGQLVINMLKILCTNAAWQRRKLGKMLQDWRVIYVQLELAFRKEFGEVSSIPEDENVCVKIFQHILLWVEEQTYWIASRFLILGFELELYSPSEYCMLELAFRKEFGEVSSIPEDENVCVKIFQHILLWVEEQTYWIASRFLILGFELELYSPSEYCMVYWYIYVVLIKLSEKTHLKMAAKNDMGKRKGKKKRDYPKDVAREYRIPPAVLFLQCQICLAEGLTMMLAALRNEHMILQSRNAFNTEQERFIQHFELLQKACILDHVSFHSFRESTTYARLSTLVMYNYFKDAQRIAKEAKSSFSNDPDKLAELRKIEQVAEHNSIALNVISRVGALDPTLKASFEFGHHPYFATAVVKRS